MQNMKLIDLLKLIANGKQPKRIKIYGYIYEYENDNYIRNGYHKIGADISVFSANGDLNTNVEIMEW